MADIRERVALKIAPTLMLNSDYIKRLREERDTLKKYNQILNHRLRSLINEVRHLRSMVQNRAKADAARRLK